MLRLNLFGGAALVEEGEEVRGAAVRQHPFAVLALLACTPSRTLSRTKLVGHLWPEVPEETARARLSSHLHRLRSRVGEGVIISSGDDLRLAAEAVTCDAWEFEEAMSADRFEEAVGVYGGPLLDGFHLRGSWAFEKWLDREQDRRHREYCRALAELGGRADDEGRPGEAVQWWQEHARADPYDVKVTLRLMASLTAAGRRAEALRVADRHRRRFEDELGATPSDAVIELADRLRSASSERPLLSSVAGEPESLLPHTAARPSRSESPGGRGDAPLSTTRAPNGADDEDRPGLRRRAATAVLVLVLAATGVLAARSVLGTGGNTASTSSRRPSLAVLPFRSIGEEGSGAIAEGLHGDLLTRLSSISGLDVVSGTSVQRFRGSVLSLPAIADSLHVTWVIEGDVQQVGDEVEINVQLIDPATDTHAWGETYRRALTTRNLFDVQADIARRVTRALETRVAANEEARLHREATESLDAYRFYVRGRALFEQATESGLRRSAAYFGEALERDSAYALAWAGLADALSRIAPYPAADPDTLLPVARRAVERALALDPELAEAYVVLGRLHLYRREGARARAAFERAVELRPGDASAHASLATLHLLTGRPGEAMEHAERAVALDPLSGETQLALLWTRLAHREWERALAAARRFYEFQSPHDSPRGLEAHALYHLRRVDELRVLGTSASLPPDRRPYLAALAARAGDTGPAEAILAGLEPEEAPLTVALLAAVLGREELAHAGLEQAALGDHRLLPGMLIFVRYLYPEELATVRAQPRYRRLLRDVEREWGMAADGDDANSAI